MVKTGHLPLWVRLDAIAARHEDGTLVCRVVMSDIAENKRMEMALRESEERYKRITHAITDYVYTVHMENGTAVSTAHGPGCLAVTGYHENEFAQDPFLWLGIVVPEDRDRVIEHAKRAAAGEETQPLEHRILRKDEEIRWVRNTTVPHRDGYGVIVSYDGLIQDITEHKLLEGQFHQAQKMESVGRLAGGVAHDFNNMLSVIIGYGELAMEKMDPADSLHGDLREILNAAERSTAIVRQLLAFARKQTIVPEVLDLNETIEGMLKMLRRLIGEDIDLAWLPETGLWPIRMDPSQIDQILANLCVNARDAIAGVGKITIETGRASFDEVYCADNIDCAPGDFALLTVNDNGCGMDKEILANLFEPFFTTKRAGEGTGLGLATVYGIIKQNNGFIHVDSEPGKGTTFEIYLPRHEGEAGMISVDSSQPISRGRGETVLMVEDEKAILTLGKTMLENLGYTVLGANSPEDALTLAREHTDEIQLLVTDVIMPGMNGLDLAEQLIVLYPEIKVLFMSGYTATTIAHHGVLDEGVRFLPKPFSMQDIATKVREALDQE
ncbi:MAG: response regulator [Desulfobacteraceae bacterium]|nr:response regulator [Desulfobacteraceae bacterium]